MVGSFVSSSWLPQTLEIYATFFVLLKIISLRVFFFFFFCFLILILELVFRIGVENEN